MLEGEPVLQALEGLLDAPALVVQIADDRGRETHGVEQVGHQDTDLAGRGDMPYQPNRGWLAIAFVIDGVVMIGGTQFDHLFVQAGAQEVAHAGEAAVAGLLDAHAERDAAFGQQCGQPAARIAVIEQEQILRAEPSLARALANACSETSCARLACCRRWPKNSSSSAWMLLRIPHSMTATSVGSGSLRRRRNAVTWSL